MSNNTNDNVTEVNTPIIENKKDKKIVIVLAVAIVACVVAGVLTYLFLSPAKTVVYVFKDSYKAGTQITEDMLASMEIDSSVVVAGGSTDTSNYLVTKNNYTNVIQSADKIKQDVSKGELLSKAMLSNESGSAAQVRLSPNKVAVSVAVDNITGVTKDLSYDTYCDIFVTYKSGSTYSLLDNVKIIDVAKNDNTLTSVTFEATKDQAVKICDAANSGSIRLGLVNTIDSNTSDLSSEDTTQSNNDNNEAIDGDGQPVLNIPDPESKN